MGVKVSHSHVGHTHSLSMGDIRVMNMPRYSMEPEGAVAEWV